MNPIETEMKEQRTRNNKYYSFYYRKEKRYEQRIKEYINTVSIINRMQRMAQNKKQRTKGDREQKSIKTIDGRG